MSDSSSLKQFSEEVEQSTNEVARDVKDTVGEMIEQGVQSVVGSQLTPQQIQQRQQQDQKNLVEVRRKIDFYKKTEEELKKIREAKRQEQMQKQQAEEQEKQAKKVQKIQMQQESKKPGAPLLEEIARSRQEIGKGHGIGG